MSARCAGDFDAVVVGAGPAGAAAARRLAQSGCRVALLERTRFDAPRIGESLAPAVQPLLAELGVWERFRALGPLPSWGTRSVWGDDAPEAHSHITSPYGCGWHVDRVAFDRMLAEAAVAAGAELLVGTSLVGCEETRAGGWGVRLAGDGREATLTAEVLIDATGRTASAARRVGARRRVFDRLVAVASQLAGIETARECYVLVETTRDGWWYSAPVPGKRMIAMLMTDADACGRADLAVAGAWQAQLNAAVTTRARLSRGTVRWGPKVFSAVSQRLQRNDAGARWLAVGDAALAVDPVSGSGVVRALRTARAGAAAALDVLSGAAECIAAYEAERDRECARYLEERARYYDIERRWDVAPFWRRRATSHGACDA